MYKRSARLAGAILGNSSRLSDGGPPLIQDGEKDSDYQGFHKTNGSEFFFIFYLRMWATLN